MKRISFSNISSKEKRFYKYVIVLFIFLLAWYGYSCIREKVCKVEFIEKIVRHDMTIIAPQGAIVAEVVDTDSSRALGLSGRNEMRENEGMLFVFDYSGKYGFWMKDMLFSIDILWINQNGVVVHIERNISPDSYPQTFINDSEALYVLELSAGGSERNGIFLGSKLKIVN